jgi:hypothetical protein
MTSRTTTGIAAASRPEFAKLLADAKLPERTVVICLRGDLVADHEAAERELEQAERQALNSLAGTGAGPIIERIEALETEMREHSYEFRLRALPRPAWLKLCTEHPPRRDEESGEIVDADRRLGVNAETFYTAIIRACLIDPVLTDEQWQQLDGSLTDRQFDELSGAAWALNRGAVDVPFSRAASLMKRDSAVG